MITVSIHAPVWGATDLVKSAVRLMTFQSTHPCGVRLLSIPLIIDSDFVSIHAPVWGATNFLDFFGMGNCFNPRTRVGCDFQITSKFFFHNRFNPRTRVGCDKLFAT